MFIYLYIKFNSFEKKVKKILNFLLTYVKKYGINYVAYFNAAEFVLTFKITEGRMTKETKSTVKPQETLEKAVFFAEKEKEDLVICEVCGYANPEKTAICKMCSNYLKGVL